MLFDRRRFTNWLMPDPKEKSDRPLRPTDRTPGVYDFSREFNGDRVVVIQPNTESYELVYVECVDYLKTVLRLEEQTCITLMDRLWDFRHVEITLTEDGVDGYVRTVDDAPLTEIQEVAAGTYRTVDPF